MFKLFVKLMMFLVILALAGPFILRGPDGQPMLSLDDLKLPDVRASLPTVTTAPDTSLLPATEKPFIQWSDRENPIFNPDRLSREQLAQLTIKEQANIYYRWQDQNGVWQFSALPNRNTLNFVVKTDPNANVLQSLTQEEIDKVFGRVSMNENSITKDNPLANGKGLDTGMLPIPATIPLDQIPKLIEQAKDVQKIADQRLKTLENL